MSLEKATPARLRTLLAAEFEACGWEYDPSVGQQIVDRVVSDGRVDAESLADKAGSAFRSRHGISKVKLSEAIESAIGDTSPIPAEVRPSGDTSVNVKLGNISGSQVNIGGNHNRANISYEETAVLNRLGAELSSGLDGEWDLEAFRGAARAVEDRQISPTDVTAIVEKAAEGRNTDEERHRAREMAESIAEKSIGGAVGTLIAQGLFALAQNPPI